MALLEVIRPPVSHLLSAAAGALFLWLYLNADSAGRFGQLPGWSSESMRDAFSQGLSTQETLDLDELLSKVSMANKTVIITTLNEAWSKPGSILTLFLESFRIGEQTESLLSHLVIVSLDAKAYGQCKSVHKHCYFLKTQGIDFSGEKAFLSEDYLKMMWRRIDFLRSVLELGYSFIFTDLDVMWFRNPFPYLPTDAHLAIACDQFRGDTSSMANSANGGFLYVQSNSSTIKFYMHWYVSRKQYPKLHDQDVFNKIKGSRFVGQLGLQMRFLDTENFGGFCQPSRDLNRVCTMHANCCIGMEKKIHDLSILLDDWRNYTARPAKEKQLGGFTWRVPDHCRDR